MLKVSAITRRTACGVAGLAAMAPALTVAGTAVPQARPGPLGDQLKALDPALRLTVEVRVNGQGPYPFIVDTGANSSMIASELADAIGLKRGGVVSIHGIAGVGTAETAVVESLQVGRRKRRDMTLSIVPWPRLGCAGLLGLDWLGSRSLMLDYRRQRMTVDAALPISDSRTTTIPAWTKRNGITLIETTVLGLRLPAFLDSGAANTVGNLAFYDAARRSGAIGAEFIPLELHSVTGQMLPGRLTRLKLLMLGAVVIRNAPVVFGPIHTFAFWDLADKPAILIGADLLQKFDSIAMDFKRGEIRFQVSGRG